MKRRYLSAIVLLVLLLDAGSYILVPSNGDIAHAAPAPRPLFDAPWTANVRVNDDVGTTSQSDPHIAVDASGNAYAVWGDPRVTGIHIYFSYRPAGGTWGENVRVTDNSTYSPDWPAIAVDGSGNAYAVWQDFRNDNWDIYFSYRPAGGAWGANVRVNDDVGTNSQDFPSIAVDSAGNAYAVWRDARNAITEWESDIYFSYRPAGGSWGTNVKVNDDPGTANNWYPAIAVDSSGNAYAVWTDRRNDNWDVYFSYRPAGDAWGANVRVNDEPGTASAFYSPAMAVDSSGNAYAVWHDLRNGNWDIYFSYRPAGGTWGANVRVNDDSGMARQGSPSIAVDPSGNAYAVWEDERNVDGYPDIYSSYRPAGGSWGGNVRVDDSESGTQGQPSIAVDPSGNAYAVWGDSRNGIANKDIYFSYRPAVQAWNFSPPYDSCVASTAQLTKSPPVGSPQVIALGFSDVDASCNPETGTINYSTLVFGGKKGHTFQPPSQWVKASADMGFEFTPPFTGSLNVEATVRVNAKLGATAGSATAVPDVQDLILLFLPNRKLKIFIRIAEVLVLETKASTETEAFIKVGEQESSVLVKGVGASFPIPPWWQFEELSEQEATVSLTVPVGEGEPIYIQAGLRTESKAYGWAASWWNPRRTQDSYVTSIILSREE